MVDLEPFLPHLPAWLLVLFRLTGIFLFAPLFGSPVVPARLKALLALGLSFCVYPMLLAPGETSSPHILSVIENGISFWSLATVVGAELAIGLVIGYGATLPLVGMQWGGRAIAQQIGIGIAEVFSPDQEQGQSLSRLYYLLALTIFLLPPINGHHLLLGTLINSFKSVPPGEFAINGQVMDLIIGLLTTMMQLAFRVAAPLLCLIFLETLATGFAARTMPQLNILSIGFAVKILLASFVLIGAINVQAGVLVEYMNQILWKISLLFGGSG